MDCVNTNFEEVYESIKKHLPSCTFVSMDLELTGIKTDFAETYLDTPHERYNKLKSAASKYRIIQIGISLFTDIGNNTYDAKTYNAYVFPRENFNFSPQIILDASAIEFNMKHKMNFQKWIYEGVPYTQIHFAKKKRDELNNPEEEKKDEPGNEVVITLEADLIKKEEFIKTINSWLATNPTEPLLLDEQSAFFRRFIYEYVHKNHPKLVAESEWKSVTSKEKIVKIYNFTEQQRKEHDEKIYKRKLDRLNSVIGFTRVIELLIEHKKPIIGHNCYFDLLFIYHSFIENLPYKYTDFKKRLNLFFPTIYDTKILAYRQPFAHLFDGGSSSLESILAKIVEDKEKVIFTKNEIFTPEGFTKYDLFNPTEGAYHEAGFDSLLTGYVFIKFFDRLCPEEKIAVKSSVNVLRLNYNLKVDKGPDDFLPKGPIYVFTKEDNDESKFIAAEVLAHFKDLKLEEDELRLALHYQFKRSAGVLRLETKDELKKDLFLKKCQKLQEEGVYIESFQEYTQRKVQESEEYSEKKKYDYKKPKDFNK